MCANTCDLQVEGKLKLRQVQLGVSLNSVKFIKLLIFLQFSISDNVSANMFNKDFVNFAIITMQNMVPKTLGTKYFSGPIHVQYALKHKPI